MQADPGAIGAQPHCRGVADIHEGSRRAFTPWRVRGVRVLAVAAAALALAGAACSPDDDGPSTGTSSTSAMTESSTTSTLTAGDAEVLAAYRAFWDAYLAAADPMDPEHPGLAEHATGKQLETLQRAFLARKAGGEVIRGTLDLAPRVVSVTGDNAAVRDCYLDSSGVYDAATGTRKDTPSGTRHLVTASLVRDGGVWKVSDLKKEGDGCTAA